MAGVAGLASEEAAVVAWRYSGLLAERAYLQGSDPGEIIDAVRSRKPPTISATAGLAL